MSTRMTSSRAYLALMKETEESEKMRARIAELEVQVKTVEAGYDAARLEISSLRAQESAIGAGGVEPLRKRECLHQISAPAVAQAPVASIYVTNDGQREFDDWRVPLPVGRNELFTAPQPAAQALDAARYRFLRDGEWRRTDLESVIRLQLNTLWDTKIDAAISDQQGKKP